MNFRKNYFIYFTSLISFFLMSIVVLIFPLSFSSYLDTDRFVSAWYFVTSTGAFYGGAVIIISIYVFLSYNIAKINGGQKSILLFVIFVFCTQILMTSLSLFVVKGIFKNPRPSQLYMIEQGIIENQQKFFDSELNERREYLQQRTDSLHSRLNNIYEPVLRNWVYESGFSFPSGHAQTSFFLATVVSFLFYKILRKKFTVVIPFLWAILVCLSRVVIGIHFPADVIGGAIIGLITGIILISFNRLNKIFV